ncbi:MAG: hypothetical protein V2B15_00005 [Bacteroidota bacterium]
MHVTLILAAMIMAFSSCNGSESKPEKKAARIHEAAFTVDSHTDTPLLLTRPGFSFMESHDPRTGRSKVDLSHASDETFLDVTGMRRTGGLLRCEPDGKHYPGAGQTRLYRQGDQQDLGRQPHPRPEGSGGGGSVKCGAPPEVRGCCDTGLL